MKIQIKHFAITIATVLLCAVASFASVVAVSTMPSAGTANLKVVDISQWNDSITSADDNINFALLKTQVDAVYIRAYGNSNGVSYIDKQAASYAKSSQDVNLLYGFYYYYIPKADIADAKLQAQSYYNFVKNYAYSCVPMLDVEDNSNNLTKAELAASVQAFADQFKALSGFSLMIYSYPDFMVHNFDPAQNWTRYKLWIAHYNVSAPMEGISSTWMPSNKWCWERWDMWQYTSTGSLSSIPSSSGGYLDISRATDNILLSTPTAVANVESPVSTGVNGGDILIKGWALSHSGISRVDIYADDFRGIALITNIYERLEVQQVINSNGRYNDGLHSGFEYLLDASFFEVGEHTLKIAVINRNGTVDWYDYKFTVGPEASMNIEAPSISQINTGDIIVSGWAVSHAGISRVDIYLDNYQGLGTAQRIDRSDVNSIINAQGGYKDALHSGFSYTIDTSRISSGKHIVRTAAISNDGSVQWTAREFTVGPESSMNIEAPSASQITTGDITVSGWAVSHAGISRVDIYLDNYQGLGTAQRIDRSDVNSIINAQGGYKDALHSGFSYIIDTSKISAGKHIVRTAAISNDGSVQWTAREFMVGPEAGTNIEAPSASQINTGDITVSGWAVSHAGISRVDIYLDNYQGLGTAQRIDRSDVNSIINAQGGYKDALHSGFSYIIDTSKISAGKHIVRTAAISNDGSVQWTAREFTVGPKV